VPKVKEAQNKTKKQKMDVKTITSSVTGNILGAVVGGVALYLGAKKVMKVENKYYVAGLVLAGAIAGAMLQSKLKSKKILASTINVVAAGNK
jgi:uncharacterized membrane protein YoaK (UPF0700 family)